MYKLRNLIVYIKEIVKLATALIFSATLEILSSCIVIVA